MAISYVVDVYRGDFAPTGWGKFAAYLSFFPHLVAGPIVRPGELIPQLDSPRDPRYVDTSRAFFLIGTGLFMKVVIANYLAANIVDEVFGAPNQHSSLEVLVGIYAYAVQIYADFFGYTYIAIGLALLLGFRFPQNFDAPYAAVSIQDFWRRWHMTLSRWLRDYLYIPLGGNRGSSLFTYRNLMLTMLIGGLWHGAGWTFVAWGAIHGTALVAERWWRERPGYVERSSTAWRRAWQRFLTFQIVCFAWIFFRSDSFSDAWEIIVRPLHRVGRAVRARHRRGAARDRDRHRLAVSSPQASARPHGALLASSGAGAGARSLGRTPRSRMPWARRAWPRSSTSSSERDRQSCRRDAASAQTSRRGAVGGCTRPGSAIVVALLALLVGVLLNAPGLRKSAEIQPEGWKRDVALALTEPLASVSGTLRLDRPRRGLKAVARTLGGRRDRYGHRGARALAGHDAGSAAAPRDVHAHAPAPDLGRRRLARRRPRPVDPASGRREARDRADRRGRRAHRERARAARRLQLVRARARGHERRRSRAPSSSCSAATTTTAS